MSSGAQLSGKEMEVLLTRRRELGKRGSKSQGVIVLKKKCYKIDVSKKFLEVSRAWQHSRGKMVPNAPSEPHVQAICIARDKRTWHTETT